MKVVLKSPFTSWALISYNAVSFVAQNYMQIQENLKYKNTVAMHLIFCEEK